MPKQVIKNLLQTDKYMLTMFEFLSAYHKNTQIRCDFTCRSQIRLTDVIPVDVLRDQLENVRKLRFTEADILKLQAEGTLSKFGLDALQEFRLPEIYVEPDYVSGRFAIWTIGPAPLASMWEIYVLSTVNTLYFHYMSKKLEISKEEAWAIGDINLDKKFQVLLDYTRRTGRVPKIVDFGARREWSPDWHAHVADRFVNEMSEYWGGTSYMYDDHYPKVGTMGHLLVMIYLALYSHNDDMLRAAHAFCLTRWHEYWDGKLSVLLNDTLGTDFSYFIGDDITVDMLGTLFTYQGGGLTRQLAFEGLGVRPDSGDPIDEGYKAAKFYSDLGIDPMSKLCLFSNGNDMIDVVCFDEIFESSGIIKAPCAIGTRLTNDFRPNFEPLSIVMKVTQVQVDGLGWVATGKLTQNKAKASGGKEFVDRMSRLVDYESAYSAVPAV